MNDITERDNTMRDVVLTACNEYELYERRYARSINCILDGWISMYANTLIPVDRAKCIVEILEYWELGNNG